MMAICFTVLQLVINILRKSRELRNVIPSYLWGLTNLIPAKVLHRLSLVFNPFLLQLW